MTLAASVLAAVEWLADMIVCGIVFVGMWINYVVDRVRERSILSMAASRTHVEPIE